MSELSRFLTSAQTKKLQESGFFSLYDFITYFPFRIQKIVPFGIESLDSQEIFLWTAKLKRISYKKNKNQFLVLDFQDGRRSIQLYLFSVANFTLKILKVEKTFQLLLKKKDNFWSLLRYSEYRPEDLCDRFILGRAENKIYLQPVYKKLKKLKSLDFLSVHNKLPDYIYKINLEGLIPKNRILSQSINLKPIHKPSSLYENKSSIKNWITLQTYLKIINYKLY
ncbi:hypothetical protein HC864_02240 [Candidatus Gracilibacteria bacterium]|nr:hypothetical protein [Candidatus Gracilibacteria bacterium]